MRTPQMLVLGGAALVASLVACSTLKVQTDADPQADLSSYKRFAFARSETHQQAPGMMDDLMRQRVEQAIAGELTKKGMQLDTTGAEPDVYVAFFTGKEQKLNVVDHGYTYGRWGAGYGYGGGSSVTQYTEGTLTVDLFDGKKKELVWRGSASDTVADREAAAKKIPQAVAKMFEKFPPSKA
jgi:Domain of unknown function (DUF4136)